ncbi:MAG: GerMN domain-containing protein [Lachnospiraceae bacterium]
MKITRYCSWIVPVLLVIMLVGCGKTKPTESTGQTIQVYYLNKDNTKLVSEEHAVLAKDQKTMLSEVFDVLRTAPDNVELKAPLTNTFKINKYYIEKSQIVLDVNEGYKKLEPTQEVLTRAALVRTLTQMEGIEYVSIKINGEPLTDLSGNPVGTMTADLFMDNAGAAINAYEQAVLRLYFANEAGDKLVEVDRTIRYNSNISLEKLVVEQLIAGPKKDLIPSISPTINPDTKILSVTSKDGTCYVNFNETFLAQIYNVSAEVSIYSLVNSLIELNNINKVQILINGKTDVIYREKTDLTTPFERNLEIVQSS